MADTPAETRDAAPSPEWLDADGQPIACVEKIKVLNENLDELEQIFQDALDDAVLMGVAPQLARDKMLGALDKLRTSFPAKEQQPKAD